MNSGPRDAGLHRTGIRGLRKGFSVRIKALHDRYGSRRRVIADFDEPVRAEITLPGVELEAIAGTRLIFAVDEVGPLVSHLAAFGSLRDLSIAEPEIEDVIARLFRSGPG